MKKRHSSKRKSSKKSDPYLKLAKTAVGASIALGVANTAILATKK